MKLFDKFKKNRKDKFLIGHNRAECIYGPPEMLEARRHGKKHEPKEFFPDNNVGEDVYGPPEMFGITGQEEPDDEERDE